MSKSRPTISFAKYIWVTVFIVMLAIWLGIPTFKKWRADKYVDELCVKNGGSEIYEVIKLPAEKVDPYWVTNLPSIENLRSEDYYYSSSRHDIRGNSGSGNLNDLVIWRSETKIIRAADNKVMAKLVSYGRRGGDPIGPWEPSQYVCPVGGFSSNLIIRQ